jgi:hypothetical protein
VPTRETLRKLHVLFPRNYRTQYEGTGLYITVTFQSVTFVVYKIYVSLLVQIWYNCHHRILEVTAHRLNTFLRLISCTFPW